MRVYMKKNGAWVEEKDSSLSLKWEEDNKYDFHYVAFAIPGLTFAAEYCMPFRKIFDYKELFYTINSNNEAGTLYPACNATFLPVHRANYYLGTIEHRSSVTTDEIKTYFHDVDKANTMMGTDTIVLDLRDFTELLLRFSYTQTALETLIHSALLNRIIVLDS